MRKLFTKRNILLFLVLMLDIAIPVTFYTGKKEPASVQMPEACPEVVFDDELYEAMTCNTSMSFSNNYLSRDEVIDMMRAVNDINRSAASFVLISNEYISVLDGEKIDEYVYIKGNIYRLNGEKI